MGAELSKESCSSRRSVGEDAMGYTAVRPSDNPFERLAIELSGADRSS